MPNHDRARSRAYTHQSCSQCTTLTAPSEWPHSGSKAETSVWYSLSCRGLCTHQWGLALRQRRLLPDTWVSHAAYQDKRPSDLLRGFQRSHRTEEHNTRPCRPVRQRISKRQFRPICQFLSGCTTENRRLLVPAQGYTLLHMVFQRWSDLQRDWPYISQR